MTGIGTVERLRRRVLLWLLSVVLS